MKNRIDDLPEELVKLIWKYYYNIILAEMYNKYFVKIWFDTNKIQKRKKNSNKNLTWAEYYSDLNTGGMIFRILSYNSVPIWLKNKGIDNYSGSSSIQKYMYDCWYRYEYWYIYDNASDSDEYEYVEFDEENESSVNLENFF